MISVREGIGYRVMGDYMAYWHEVYTLIAQLVYQNYPRMLSAQSPYNA